jgi:hypothetical protein
MRAVEADEFRAAECTGEADEHQGTVAQPGQILAAGGD